jgi:tetratricopeptide (TPR) repeat protein
MTADDDVALLQQLLDLPVAPERLAQRSPEARQARTFALLRHLVLDAAQRQPLVLMVENLHWIDPTSDAWLASLVERLAGAAVLVLGTYRPGYQPLWGAHAVVTQVALSPLSAQTSRRVVDAVVGAVSLPEVRLQTVVEQAGGNPFFLEELAWHAVEQGGLDTLGAVPETVQAVLAARFDRLPSEAKRLLQTAAVIGMQMTLPLLQAVTELSDAALHTGLTRLQAVELLHETRVVPELIYTFKHALIHEVAYGGLLQERRRELHARIVDAIETLHRDRLDGEIERLAHHALRGQMREKAVHYLRQAGLKAAARSAPQEARVWFEQALAVLEALSEDQSALEQAYEIRLELRPVLHQLGEVRQTLDRLREAEALAERLNDERRRGRVCAFMTIVHSLLGDLDEALVTGSRALEIAGRLGDLRLRILATTYLELANHSRGEYERVVELATDNLAALSADSVDEYFGATVPPSVWERHFLVVSLVQLGRFAEAAEHKDEALRLAEPTHHAFTVGLARFAAGTLHLLQGDWARARSVIEQWIAVARAGNVVLHLPWAVASSAWVSAQLGETSHSLDRLREGEQLLERQAATGIAAHLGWGYHSLGRACLLLGRLDEARRLGDRAVECSKRQPGFAAHALHLLGDIATRPDRFDAESGEAHYRKALALAEPRGMRPLVAHCHLALGKLHRRTGKHQQAQEHLSTAMMMYREMNMRFWLDQAEAQITQASG